MKRLFMLLTVMLVSVTVVLCQDDSVKDILIGLGVKSSVALIASAIILFAIGHFAVPNKFASALVWLEKLFYGLWWLLKKLNEKDPTNRLSKPQKAVKLARMQMAQRAGAVMTLLFLFGMLSAQSPFAGFFDNKNKAVSENVLLMADENGSQPSGVWLFRMTAAMTATAYDFYESPVVIKAVETFGFGLSYGKYETIDNEAYCKLAVNAMLATSVNLNGAQSLSMGPVVTAGLFNNHLQFGLGLLEKRVMPLINVGITF